MTVSLMTYLVYAYYSTEITAKMTSRPPDVQIKSFKGPFIKDVVKIFGIFDPPFPMSVFWPDS